MSKVFLDIGNSFIKWTTVESGFYEIHDPLKIDSVIESGLGALELNNPPKEVFFSSVANAEHVDELKSLIQEEWQILPYQLTAQKQCCGLISGYRDFSTLGDDRWFAMLGALEISGGAFIVIDAGTAMTVDAVIENQHKGGFIVPGLYTMRKSLAANTADLADYNGSDLSSEVDALEALATNTSSAILGGTLYMTAAFINHLLSDLSHQLNTPFDVFLTGGEAQSLQPLLDVESELVPDLVLQGMMFYEESVKKQ
jgi:type III pantothenate kinase